MRSADADKKIHSIESLQSERSRLRKEGKTVIELPPTTLRLSPGESKTTTASVSWRNARLWDIHDPYLYFLETDDAGPHGNGQSHVDPSRGFRRWRHRMRSMSAPTARSLSSIGS